MGQFIHRRRAETGKVGGKKVGGHDEHDGGHSKGGKSPGHIGGGVHPEGEEPGDRGLQPVKKPLRQGIHGGLKGGGQQLHPSGKAGAQVLRQGLEGGQQLLPTHGESGNLSHGGADQAPYQGAQSHKDQDQEPQGGDCPGELEALVKPTDQGGEGPGHKKGQQKRGKQGNERRSQPDNGPEAGTPK